MTDAFGASDSEGAWDWKSAYDACEVAEILFLRRYGQAIVGRATPSALALIERIAALMPTHTQIGRAHPELQSLMRISYAVFCLKKNTHHKIHHYLTYPHHTYN